MTKILDIASFDVSSGIDASTLRPFCEVRAVSKDQEVVLLAHIPPATAREQAHALLEAAEASEIESLVVRLLVEEVGMPMRAAVGFLVLMREKRGPKEEPKDAP